MCLCSSLHLCIVLRGEDERSSLFEGNVAHFTLLAEKLGAELNYPALSCLVWNSHFPAQHQHNNAERADICKGEVCKCCCECLAYSSSFSASLLKSLHLRAINTVSHQAAPGLRLLLQLKLCSPGLRQGEWEPDASGSAVVPLHTAAVGLTMVASWWKKKGNLFIHKYLTALWL